MNIKIEGSSGWFDKILSGLEKAGNALPHPAPTFAFFAISEPV